jgi:hypothetical protein
MIKKSLIFLACILFLSTLIVAYEYKMEVSIISKNKIIEPGELIKLKITLRDSNNKIIEDDILIIIKDKNGIIIKEEIIKSKDIAEIRLTDEGLAGEGKIIARYKDLEVIESFFIAESKLVEFKLDGEKLIITNVGNTIYNEIIYITIGKTMGSKTPNLEIGQSISYRLIAPEGNYNVKVTNQEGHTIFVTGEVRLTGTGQAVAVLDERGSQLGITGISPNEESEGVLLSHIKGDQFIYVFVLVVFGATILLAIERRFEKTYKK